MIRSDYIQSDFILDVEDRVDSISGVENKFDRDVIEECYFKQMSVKDAAEYILANLPKVKSGRKKK